jgi:predicted RNase H-like nuclease (RuvC/YqgF family)
MDEPVNRGVLKGSFTISLQIAGRTVQVSHYIIDGEGVSDVIRHMNEMQEAIDHQMIRANTEDQEGKLKGNEMELKRMLDQYDSIKAKQERLPDGKQIASMEQKWLDDFDVNRNFLKQTIRERKAQIEENNKRLAKQLNGKKAAASVQ